MADVMGLDASGPFLRVPYPPILDDLRARHHAVIEASAGTGKTYTLEHLFIDLLIGDGRRAPIPIDRILLVTFTEKAVQELRNRCHALLEEIVGLGERALKGEPARAADAPGKCPGYCLQRDTGAPCPCLGDGERRCWSLARAEFELLRKALLDFDMANISTIHAFCQRTLVEEAFQRGALFHEEVVPFSELFDRVFQRCLRREFAIGPCGWAFRLWLSKGNALFRADGRSGNQGQALSTLLEAIVKAGGRPTQSKEMLRARMRQGLAAELNRCLATLGPAIEALAAADGPRVDVERLSGAFEALDRLLGGLPEAALESPGFAWFNRYFYRLAFTPEPASGKVAKASLAARLSLPADFSGVDWPDDPRLGVLPDLASAFALRDRLDLLLEPEEGPSARRPEVLAATRCVERFLGCLPLTIEACVAAALTPPLVSALAEEKRARGLIDYDDMLTRLDEALGDPARGAELRANLRQRYRALLIDEFQDTDEVQWRIFEKIIGDPLRIDPERTPRLVLIGDPKQSIYRFRGADLPTYVAARESLCADGHEAIRLATNFRTSPMLVQALNILFDPEACERVDVLPGEGECLLCERIAGRPAEEIAAADAAEELTAARSIGWHRLDPVDPGVQPGPRLKETRAGFEVAPATARFLAHADYGGSPRVEAGNQRARAFEAGREAAPLCLFEMDVEKIVNKPGVTSGSINKKKFFRAQARLIAAEIERLRDPATGFLFDDGRGAAGAPRRLRLNDVFILIRDKAAMLTELKAALDERGIPGCARDASIFESPEARELLDLLRAIERPMDRALRHRAALTSFFGFTPAAIAAMGEGAEEALAARLLDWRAACDVGGCARLFERICAQSGVQRRNLFDQRLRPFANLAHLFDALIVETSDRRLQLGEVIALLDGLIHGRRDLGEDARNKFKLRTLNPPSLGVGAGGEAGDAVQILTMHAAKGLEAPVVFVMDDVIWRNRHFAVMRPARAGVPRSVHVGEVVMSEDDGGPEAAGTFGDKLVQELQLESDADAERLLYVAMTRAMVRLYLPRVHVAALQEKARKKLGRSGYGRLNARLLALREVRRFEAEAGEALAVAGAEDGPGATRPDALRRLADSIHQVEACDAPPTGNRPRAMAMTSYSQLAHGSAPLASTFHPVATEEAQTAGALAIEDEESPREEWEEGAPSRSEAVLLPLQEGELPGGTDTGNLVHALFEKLPGELVRAARSDEDLLSSARFDEILRREQAAFGLALSDAQRLHAAHLVRATLSAPLAIGEDGSRVRLLDLASKPVHELEFLFPIPEDSHALLSKACRDAGFEAERGFIKGFIDIAFEHDGRFWLGDWKTDRLEDALPQTLARHVEAHYAVQVQLYTLALARLIGATDRDTFERRFGGFLYFFVRLTDGSSMRGVHLLRPTFDDLVRWERGLLTAPLAQDDRETP